jgi:hypothetical protein
MTELVRVSSRLTVAYRLGMAALYALGIGACALGAASGRLRWFYWAVLALLVIGVPKFVRELFAVRTVYAGPEGLVVTGLLRTVEISYGSIVGIELLRRSREAALFCIRVEPECAFGREIRFLPPARITLWRHPTGPHPTMMFLCERAGLRGP